MSIRRTLPINPDTGKFVGLGSVVFCATHVEEEPLPLTVTKDVQTVYAMPYTWSVVKSSAKEGLTLDPGQVYEMGYRVEVNATAGEATWVAFGAITVRNPNPERGAEVTVRDVISRDGEDDIIAELACAGDAPITSDMDNSMPGGDWCDDGKCGSRLVVPPATDASTPGEAICTYRAILPDNAVRLNTATVTTHKGGDSER